MKDKRSKTNVKDRIPLLSMLSNPFIYLGVLLLFLELAFGIMATRAQGSMTIIFLIIMGVIFLSYLGALICIAIWKPLALYRPCKFFPGSLTSFEKVSNLKLGPEGELLRAENELVVAVNNLKAKQRKLEKVLRTTSESLGPEKKEELFKTIETLMKESETLDMPTIQR